MVESGLTESPLILIASHRDEIRQIIRGILERASYRLIEASDTVQTVEQCDREHPAVVLLDLTFGVTLCEQIKERHGATVSILALVDSLHPVVLDRALEAGAEDTVLIPIHPTTLERRIHHAL